MNLAELAESMMRKGIDVPTIGDILDVDLDSLYQLRETINVAIERDDVDDAMNRLAWRAFEKGLEILETGTPTARMAIIRMMMSSMRGRLGSQSPKVMAELIAEFRESIELTEDSDDEIYQPEEVLEDEAVASNSSD